MDNKPVFTVVDNMQVITRLMQEFATLKTRLLIKPCDTSIPRIYHSSVVKYDEESTRLVIHQPKPALEADKLQEQEVQISCQLHSGHYQFQTSICAIPDTDGIQYWQVLAPLTITKQQLRSYFRISMVRHNARIEIAADTETPICLECVDLSQGGVLCQLPRNKPLIPSWLTKGTELNNCRIRIDDLLDIRCTGSVTRISSDKKYNTLIGIEFLELEDTQLNLIGQTINKLERRNLQQMSIA